MTQFDFFVTRYQDFEGSTYVRERDHERLASLLERVQKLMADGKRRSLREIAKVCGGTEASVSARLRDLRKSKFGGHTVLREHVSRGLFVYWMERA